MRSPAPPNGISDNSSRSGDGFSSPVEDAVDDGLFLCRQCRPCQILWRGAGIADQAGASIRVGTALSLNRNKLPSVLPGAAATVGDRLPGRPRFTISNHAQYTADLGDGRSIYGRLGHRYLGKAYSDFNNATALTFGGCNLFGLRLGYKINAFEMVAFIDNLTDRDDFSNAVRLSNGPAAIRLQPRTFGLALRTQL